MEYFYEGHNCNAAEFVMNTIVVCREGDGEEIVDNIVCCGKRKYAEYDIELETHKRQSIERDSHNHAGMYPPDIEDVNISRVDIESIVNISREKHGSNCIFKYFPILTDNDSKLVNSYGQHSPSQTHNLMDMSYACASCQQNFYSAELQICNFCLKHLCNFCDCTCKRCGLPFCKNCSTTLYTQFSEDLVCLDCMHIVMCIS